MPIMPHNTTCAMLNCKEPRSKMNSYCAAHGGREYGNPRQTDERYRTKAWQSIRARQLSTQPLCQACLLAGRVCAAEHVDHVFPWVAVGERAFLRNLFQSLCQPCHSHKTAQERKGIIEHYGPRLLLYGLEDYGSVVGCG